MHLSISEAWNRQYRAANAEAVKQHYEFTPKPDGHAFYITFHATLAYYLYFLAYYSNVTPSLTVALTSHDGYRLAVGRLNKMNIEMAQHRT